MFEPLEKEISSSSVKPSMARAISLTELTTSFDAMPKLEEKSSANCSTFSKPLAPIPAALTSLIARLNSIAGSSALFRATPAPTIPATPMPIFFIASAPRLPKSSIDFMTPFNGAESWSVKLMIYSRPCTADIMKP